MKKLYSRFLITSKAPRHAELRNDGIGITSETPYICSLSQLARDFIDAASAIGIPYALINTAFPFLKRKMISEKEREEFKKRECRIFDQRHVINFSTIPCYMDNRYCNAITPFWEFQSGMLEHRPGLFDGADVVIAYSDFLKEYFESLLPKRTRILKFRYPYRPAKINIPEHAVLRKMFDLPETGFLVFYNFDYSSSYGRKNPEAALAAFADAFPASSDDAIMIFKTSHAKDHPADATKLRDVAKKLGIEKRTVFFDNYMPREKLLLLTAAANAYISLHRGEGLGMGMLEAMTLSVPVIATNFGGNTDFVTPDTAYPVPYTLVDVQSDMTAYNYVAKWAQPDVDAAASFLRQVHDTPEQAKQKSQKAAAFIAKTYSDETFREDISSFLAI